ncbi:hypothetical protein EDI_107910 [Entamoeba dispar SAW760]|uniref:Uncharacterized protein n=1 Tax=Entamoeba dispar (strain ATCC PRA-260 / SAW760) TaxID=370354 RepID=B0EPL6_ENTDS|nr:uncharacterized protein EDI_107910 [Entamoeba dispar SAW760]EDR23532.1 hypothetical protein EDI_107910 [Entamoeba dispar SAW760]|eukprot:EDR23532.1 hypothetical protein EDI_107910 [Entamoeba dispar SAW760]
MNKLIILFITFSLSKKCSEVELYKFITDTVDSAFECIESIETTEKENNSIINDLKYYLEGCVFKDILKNPPQPSFSNNYYEKVDIDEQLNTINTKTTSMYEFYSQIKNLIISTRDSHLSFRIRNENEFFNLNENNEITLFYYFLPFTTNIDNNKKMYLNPRYYYGLSFVNTPNEIINNQNVVVKTVNGEYPFNIIHEFGKKYSALKCPHAQFTEAKDDLVEGKSLTVNYKIYRETTDVTKSNEKIKQGIRKPLTEEETKEMINTKKALEENDRITTKFISSDSNIYCTFCVNGVNTLVVKSFDTRDTTTYEDTITECIDLFDSNNYPIQVIFPKNGGGYIIYSQWIEKRYHHMMINFIKKGYAVNLYEPETCQRRRGKFISSVPLLNLFSLGELYTKPNIIKYGDVEHKITQPSIEVFPKKKIMKNPRKPTEIVVYTDSYCYSACSLVTKGLKEC